MRDLFSFRMALRCTTPEASDTVLGQGWASQGYSASTLDPTARGVGFLLAEGAVPVKIRTHYLADDDIAALTKRAEARAAARRPRWPVKSASEWREILAEVNQAGGCAHPIRLRGNRLDRVNGELVDTGIVVPCKDRRAAVCPSCSRLYQADAWQLVAAGIRGGKGVSPDVARAPPALRHPHRPLLRSGPQPVSIGDGGPALPTPTRCRRLSPRAVARLPRSGTPKAIPLLGEPLCADCFDYRGAVLWNAHVPALWERTSSELYRAVAKAGGLSTKEVRSMVRLSYMKVVEFQRRGLVHLHVVVRADGRDGPAEHAPVLARRSRCSSTAVNDAVARASVAVPAVGGTPLDPGVVGSRARRPGPRPEP